MSDFTGYKLPRPPIFRLCTLGLRSDGWPDRGGGVWQIEGYENMDTHQELYLLRRVMPAEPGGGTGERIKFWRMGHDSGHLSVWRKDLIDPKYSPSASGVKPSQAPSRLPPPELTWLYTHCRALGMTKNSDSGKWEHDIALFVADLHHAASGVAPIEAPSYTYASTQATNCARCGQHKHTPLRVDRMDGYVCLTCIDEELGRLLDEEVARAAGVALPREPKENDRG